MMINIQDTLALILLMALAFPCPGSAQQSLTDELKYEVNRIYPPISITRTGINEANTLIDLDKNFKSSWIREYISVEVQTTSRGKLMKAVGENDMLSQQQKDLMNMADAGSDITVKVLYMPENTLKNNDIKQIDFTFSVDPESEARYVGGYKQLNQYLRENAIDKIPDGSFNGLDLAAVKFAIDADGQIIDVQLFETSNNDRIDELLIATISNMPNWLPAEHADGTRVRQEFVLTVGSMENCMINLLNIHQD